MSTGGKVEDKLTRFQRDSYARDTKQCSPADSVESTDWAASLTPERNSVPEVHESSVGAGDRDNINSARKEMSLNRVCALHIPLDIRK